jgi:hypothetical protein
VAVRRSAYSCQIRRSCSNNLTVFDDCDCTLGCQVLVWRRWCWMCSL